MGDAAVAAVGRRPDGRRTGPVALEARATEVFLKLQECWQAREYGPMEGLMVPFLFKEHCRQLAGMRANPRSSQSWNERSANVGIVNGM